MVRWSCSFRRKLPRGFLHTQAQGLGRVGKGSGIEISYPVILRHPALWGKSHATADCYPIQDSRYGTASTKVTGYHSKGSLQIAGPVAIEPTNQTGNIRAAQHLSRPFRDKFMARTMKTMPPDTGIIPTSGNRIAGPCLGQPLVKGSLEQCNPPGFRENIPELSDSGCIGRIVRGSDISKSESIAGS